MAKEVNDKNLDWFPFYADRFMMGTAQWNDEEVGIYIKLLIIQWRNGYIMDDIDRIIALTSIRDMARFNKVWEFMSNKFPVSNTFFNIWMKANSKLTEADCPQWVIDIYKANDGNRRNFILEEIRAEQLGKVNGKKTRAKKAADARWNTVELPFPDEVFKSEWKRWKDYKKIQHRFEFKSEDSEATALKGLAKLAGGEVKLALELIDYAIEKGWKGIYSLPANYKSKTLSSPHELRQQDYKEKL